MVFQYRSAWISDDKPHEKAIPSVDKPKRSVASPEALELCGITMPCVGMCCRFPIAIGEECAVCNGSRTAAYRQASLHSAFLLLPIRK